MKAPLGALQTLPASPALSDILNADLANLGLANEWRAEVKAWRDWWTAQSAAWAKP